MPRKTLLPSILLALALITAPAVAAEPPAGMVDIPYTRHVLDNGLTLIVHEDHKAPIVAVNVWYDVGSADEQPGKTGFAHLFEHLMFNGSENYDGEYSKPFDRVGVTELNGTTSFDRTNYYQVVPATALDLALWMESDRMGHFLGVLSEEKLANEREVVKNEKRQGEDQPYGKAFGTIFESTYPDGHPYDHTVIGSMADLDAASLEDVQEWFRTYYGPSNAVLVVAGDVEPEDVRARVEKHFGDIPPGPPLTKPAADVARRSQPSRTVMQDRVPQARLYRAWNVAAFGDPAVDGLDLASELLTGGKNSRLYKRLVYEDQVATDVVSFNFTRQLGGLFIVWATARPGQELAAVERALEEEMERFLAEGPAPGELARVQARLRADFLSGLERVGGQGGKSDVLAAGEVYLGSPGAYAEQQARLQTLTAEEVQRAARGWLGEGAFTLEVHPYPALEAAAAGVDRSTGPPEVTAMPQARFPDLQRAELANGLTVVLARRTAVPMVSLQLSLDAGYAADPADRPGTVNLAMAMLDEGTESRSALGVADELERLGASLAAGSNLDQSYVRMTALTENLDPSLDLFADVVLRPSFPAAELERLRQQQLAAIRREKAQPMSLALRVLPGLLYGAGHAYSLPFTGSGTEESVRRITLEEVRGFHDTWFQPGNATLVVVGDVTLEELLPRLERHFGGWQGRPAPEKNLAAVAPAGEATVYLLDRPGAEQSVIFAGHLVPPKDNPHETAVETVNEILGGGFSARLNQNLRLDKGWSYGAGSVIVDAAGQRPFFVYAPVQTDKTAESMAEIAGELAGIRAGGAAPPTAEELAEAKAKQTLTLPGRWETNGAVLADVAQMVRFGLPADYWDTYAGRVRALDLEEVAARADALLQPDRAVWVVVGDRARIEAGIRALGLGDIRPLDPDGRPLAPPAPAG